MKVINSNQKSHQIQEINFIYSKLTQINGLISLINNHIKQNKILCFNYDINHGLLWNIETLLNECYDTLENNGDYGKPLQGFYIPLYEPLTKAKATILFMITHLEDNKRFLFGPKVLESILLNITDLINLALDKIKEGEQWKE